MGAILSGDLDKSFAYDTKQCVNIQDRALGFTQSVLTLLIVTYIVLGVFWYGQGYLEVDQTRGLIASHVRGDTVSESLGKPGARYFSAEEISYPGLENGNVFVTTRMEVYQQKRGVCEDRSKPCVTSADCTAALGGACAESGFCNEAAWCDQDPLPEIYELDTKDFHIWVKSAVQFVKLERNGQKDIFRDTFPPMPWIFSTERDHPYPEHGYNLFSVNELLLMCEPVPIRYEEISELGASIEVSFSWSCDMTNKDCKPTVTARRMDVLIDPENIGYGFKYAEHVSDDERVLHEVRGVRIFFRTVGRGTMFDTNALIMKLATTTSLLCLAPIVADLLMLNVFARRQKYRARKMEISPDFSDYMDRQQAKQEQMRSRRHATTATDEQRAREREEQWHRRMREEED